MSETERYQFNRMRGMLLKIAKGYSTPAKLRKECQRTWGVDYDEALEMAYENIQAEAAEAIKGVREVKL